MLGGRLYRDGRSQKFYNGGCRRGGWREDLLGGRFGRCGFEGEGGEWGFWVFGGVFLRRVCDGRRNVWKVF